MNRTKIVATIGPRTADDDGIAALVEAGIDVARLNGSHADPAWHAEAIARIRRVAPGIPILLDIPGRKIRTRGLAESAPFAVGDEITLTTDPDGRDGAIQVTSDTLHEHLRPGDPVMADDGTLRFVVVRVDGRSIVCRAETAGTLGLAKGINVPSVDLGSQLLTAADRAMLEFARTQAVDFVGISFVDGASLVHAVRDALGDDGPRVVAKVESLGGMTRLEEVIDAADAVMVDRGDLSVETNLEGIALAQKRILAVATARGKPVIVATEMLSSMVDRPHPTKAEVTDISNAVLDGASALMLSAETAVGSFPTEAVAMMRRIADTVTATIVPPEPSNDDHLASIPLAMGEAIARLCRTLPVTKIVAITRSGYAARMIASYRPRQEILVVTDRASTARAAGLLFGCRGVHVDVQFPRRSTDHVVACLEQLWRRDLIRDDDVVLATTVGYPGNGNRMNLIQTHLVRDLRAALAWSRDGTSGRPAGVVLAAVAGSRGPRRAERAGMPARPRRSDGTGRRTTPVAGW